MAKIGIKIGLLDFQIVRFTDFQKIITDYPMRFTKVIGKKSCKIQYLKVGIENRLSYANLTIRKPDDPKIYIGLGNCRLMFRTNSSSPLSLSS